MWCWRCGSGLGSRCFARWLRGGIFKRASRLASGWSWPQRLRWRHGPPSWRRHSLSSTTTLAGLLFVSLSSWRRCFWSTEMSGVKIGANRYRQCSCWPCWPCSRRGRFCRTGVRTSSAGTCLVFGTGTTCSSRRSRSKAASRSIPGCRRTPSCSAAPTPAASTRRT